MSMTDAAPSLSEAVTKFVAEKKNSKKDMGNSQELGKFVAWCGRDRAVEQLSPSEVADYAQHIGLGGADSAQRLGPVKLFLTYLKQEGWTETSLASHLRVPRGRRLAGGGAKRFEWRQLLGRNPTQPGGLRPAGLPVGCPQRRAGQYRCRHQAGDGG